MKRNWLILMAMGVLSVGLMAGDASAQQAGRKCGNRTGPQDGSGPQCVQARDGSGQQAGNRQGEGRGEYRKGKGQGEGWHRDGTGSRVGNRQQLRDDTCDQ